MPDFDDQHGLLPERGGGIEGIKGYLLGIFAAALVCALVNRLVKDKGAAGASLKMITGLFMVFTVINPLAKLSWTNIGLWTGDFSGNAAMIAAEGERSTREALAAVIKTRSEAYILDKALALELQLQVEVVLSEDDIPVPETVRLSGRASPYARARLQQFIEEDLGIDKEHQIWI